VTEKTEMTATASQRGAAVAEVLLAIATLGAAVLAGSMIGPKYPYACGE